MFSTRAVWAKFKQTNKQAPQLPCKNTNTINYSMEKCLIWLTWCSSNLSHYLTKN